MVRRSGYDVCKSSCQTRNVEIERKVKSRLKSGSGGQVFRPEYFVLPSEGCMLDSTEKFLGEFQNCTSFVRADPQTTLRPVPKWGSKSNVRIVVIKAVCYSSSCFFLFQVW